MERGEEFRAEVNGEGGLSRHPSRWQVSCDIGDISHTVSTDAAFFLVDSTGLQANSINLEY